VRDRPTSPYTLFLTPERLAMETRFFFFSGSIAVPLSTFPHDLIIPKLSRFFSLARPFSIS